MPANATSVPATCCRRRRSAPSQARIASVNSGWQVSTSEEENAVDRFMPYITALMCSTWPTRAHARKRGRSGRRGQVCADGGRGADAAEVMARITRPAPARGVA
ncbi:hypothetical protein D3C83_40430 [compost metagenome]